MADYITYFNGIVRAPLSGILSLLLIFGVAYVGRLPYILLGGLTKELKLAIKWQSVAVGSAIIVAVLYPIALLEVLTREFLIGSAIALLMMGIVQLSILSKNFQIQKNQIKKWVQNDRLVSFLIISIVLAYIMISLGPITNADALDYHLGGALYLLNTGHMPINFEWFHGRLVGSGELLIALGLSVGAEQFSSLIQVFSLVGICGVLSCINHSCLGSAFIRLRNLTVLSILSSPVNLFLISTPKPQLWPIALTATSFYLLIKIYRGSFCKKTELSIFILAVFLCLSAANAKFNYLLTAGLLCGVACYIMWLKRALASALQMLIVLICVILVPALVWKFINFDAEILDVFLSPLPGNFPGTSEFIQVSRRSSDVESAFPYPLSLILPDKIGAVSSVLGIAWIPIFAIGMLTPHRQSFIFNLTVWGMILALVVLAPPAGRIYYEPIIFSCIIFLGLNWNGNKLVSIARPIAVMQAAFCLVCAVLGAGLLFPGAVSDDSHKRIMREHAIGYDVMEWVDQILPSDAILLVGIRSIGLSPRRSVSMQGLDYAPTKSKGSTIYLKQIKNSNANYVLIGGEDPNNEPLRGCFGKKIGSFDAIFATRNPYNSNSKYKVSLYEFQSNKALECGRE